MNKAKILVLVESPAKVKSISRILGENYVCIASYGHIMDLPSNRLGIDCENAFDLEYAVIDGKDRYVNNIKKYAVGKELVLLATDPDREGEVISWHISQHLPKGAMYQRVVFNSITDEIVKKAILHPRALDMDLIYSQQARRVVDRLVGYKVSHLLNKSFGRKRHKGNMLSAGRVQSATLSLIVCREEEICKFVPQVYWDPDIILCVDKYEVPAEVVCWSGEAIYDDNRAEPYLINSQDKADCFVKTIQQTQQWVISLKKQSKKKVSPPLAFTTAALQKTANSKLGFSVEKTSKLAQDLYEGVDCGKFGNRGLITYMRTDSVRVSSEGVSMAQQFIKDRWGEDYIGVGNRPKKTTGKRDQKKNKPKVQDAHEAIRPVELDFWEGAHNYLSPDHYKLYILICKQFIASQMSSAVYANVNITIESEHKHKLKVQASKLHFPGYNMVFDVNEKEHILYDCVSAISKVVDIQISDVKIVKKQTTPKPRYTEGSLVSTLESLGIGRPSTYVAILKKIKDRAYTIVEKNSIRPTDVGVLVVQWMQKYFPDLIDISFTAKIEEEIEGIADRERQLLSVLTKFWEQFSQSYNNVATQIKPHKEQDDNMHCEKCGASMIKISTDIYSFWGCSAYPACKYVVYNKNKKDIDENPLSPEDFSEDFQWDQLCKICGGGMRGINGRYGAFLGCKMFPKCKYVVKIPLKGEKCVMDCVVQGCDGKIWEKSDGSSRMFFMCSNYGQCRVKGATLKDITQKFSGASLSPAKKN